ncbi:MAG: addiction module toxin RelE, partial [Gammaproteobacteria bacterium HGW-Gammaproteobacteria-7]
RLEFDCALYHVMARGNAREAIFLDDEDRRAFVANLGRVAGRFDWRLWAWCLMGNHYHLLVETLRPTLSRGMREVNGVYTQAFNRRHGRVGHVLQGRYKAVLVDKDSYLLELSRYVVLNPVRAGLAAIAADWPWSSYRAVMGKAAAPEWLAVSDTLALFHSERGPARRAYARFVAEGAQSADPTAAIEHQVLLGSEAFVERMAALAAQRQVATEVPRRARPVRSLRSIERETPDRDEAIRAAYATGGYTLRQIGDHFELHYSVVSRIARGDRLRRAKNKT